MANIAQMVNVLQAMILTDGEKMVLMPTYHAFEMHIPFQDSTALAADIETPEYRRGEWAMPAVDISAARDAQGRIQIAAVNVDPRRSATATVKITGIKAKAVNGRVLTAAAMDARNRFDRAPDVQPAPFSGKAEGETVTLTLPPKSLVVVAVDE